MMVTFSAANMWWYCTNLSVLVFGPIAVLIFYYFINNRKWFQKLLLSIALAIIGLNYIFILYPAWQVPFGYVFLCLIIWIAIENRKKFKVKDLIYLIPFLLILGSITSYVFSNSIDIFDIVTNTVYPGKRMSTGGYGYNLLFDYFISLFLPILSYPNPSEASNFLSFYPVPILMAIYYMIKEKVKDSFLIILSICAILVSIWNYVKLPTFIAKLSLISFSIPERANLVVGLICILLLIRLISTYESNEKITTNKIIFSLVIAILTISLSIFINYNSFSSYLNIYMIIITIIILGLLLTLILINNKKTNKVLAISLIFLSLFIGGTVNPINKGISVLTDKPFAKEVQKIVKQDKTKKWMTVNCDFGVSDYLIANGASTINSVNYYPNLKLWKKLDPKGKYINIYNRYAHITITLSYDKTNFELTQNDKFNINLNNNDIMLLGAYYVVSQQDISMYQTDSIKYNLIYKEDGMYIYKIES